ncbi:M23 family metallopeptidase [Natronospora cellulosivora (SeqCode)]
MSIISKFFSYLLESMNITIIPSAHKKIKNYKIRRVIPFSIIVIIISSIAILSVAYNYYNQNYHEILKEYRELDGVRTENRVLKNELFDLVQETEKLKENLSRLKDQNQEIKELLEGEETSSNASLSTDIDLQLHTSLSDENVVMPKGLAVGGGDFYIDNTAYSMINKARANISMIKSELPDQEENLGRLENSAIEYNNLKAATPSIWPLLDNGEGFITSNYGWRSDPFTGQQQIHEGIDIGVWYNTPVVATADGVVEFAGRQGGYGILLIIDHGYGYETRYAHLNKVEVRKGQEVSRGDIIALSGNTGRSSGPHLHYEVRINGIPQEPRDYIGG